jgi:FkbM family methyltransferase
MLFFKIIFKEIYHLFRKKGNRQFLWLSFWYGNKPRHRPLHLKIGGQQWHIPDALSFIWQYKEIFGDESYRFESNNAQPLIYDCGSNVGLSIAYFRQLYPNAEIKAFEADAKIADYLQENLQKNNIKGVKIHQKAVWIHDKGIEMQSDGADTASIIQIKDAQNIVSVPSIRLKDLLAQETQIDMLKMDIEGAEVEVLEDCAEELAKIQHLFIEYHAYIGQSQSLAGILNLLELNGFRYYLTNPHQKDAPLVNRLPKNKEATMDLQMNIHAYR